MTMSHSAMSCRRRLLDDWLALSGQMITGFNTLSTIISCDLVSKLPLIIFSLLNPVGFFVISLLVNIGACACFQEQWAVLSQFHYSGYLFWNHLLHLSVWALSGRHLNCSMFCSQTWHCGALSWARVSCKKTGSLSSRSRSQWGLIWSEYDFWTIFSELMIVLKPNLLWW